MEHWTKTLPMPQRAMPFRIVPLSFARSLVSTK
jgi:hypothetical protein